MTTTGITSLVNALLDEQINCDDFEQAGLIIAAMARSKKERLARITARATLLDGRTRLAEERRQAASTLGRGCERKAS